MTDSPLRVLIIGAGIGGLALGQALVAGGVEVRICERNRDAAAWLDGYRLNINPDGARALHRCLPAELWEAFVATCPTPPGGISFRTEQLRELFTITREDMTGGSADPADGQFGVSRRVLRTLLLAGLHDDHVTFGAEFERYAVDADGTVTASFADGRTATADLLVGADGANSRVRHQYLPHAERVPSDAGGIAARLPLDDQTRTWLPPVLTEGMTLVMPPSGRASMFTSAFPGRDALTAAIAEGVGLAGLGLDQDALLDDTDDYVLWSVIADHRVLGDVADGPALQALALDLVRGWDPALRRIIAESDPASLTAMRFRQSTLVEPWTSTTVTVLGDAIHNMPPVGGLGANSALRDAAALADQLLAVSRGAPLVPAIAAYEEQMRGWGYAAVRASGANARRATDPSQVKRRAGRAYFRARGAMRSMGRQSGRVPAGTPSRARHR